jgi:hypothetical protein
MAACAAAGDLLDDGARAGGEVEPALICLPPTLMQPPLPTWRRTSTIPSAGSGPGGSAVAGEGRPGLPPVARSRARSLSSRVTWQV